MTNEETKVVLKSLADNPLLSAEHITKALYKAIELVESQPCEDCISRAEALMAIDFAWSENDDWDFRLNIERRIKKFPAVQPARPKGRWREKELDIYECEICHEGYCEGFKENYCPNCGADMRGDANDE